MPNNSNLEVWQLGKAIAVDVLKMWEKLDGRRYFGLRDQMQRAAVSIPSNIAEGSERKSAKEFVRYLYIAKGSAAELGTQLEILNELEIAEVLELSSFQARVELLIKKIQRLITAVYRGNTKNCTG